MGGKRLATTLLSRINYQPLPKISEWFSASVLHVAAAFQIPKLLQEAHDEGVSIDDLDGRGYSPLRWAVIAQSRPIIQLLHRLGASFADYDNQGFTTLAWSIGQDHRRYSVSQDISVVENSSLLFGDTITLNSSLSRAITFGNSIFPVYTELDILVMLVRLSPFNILLADAPILMLLACSKHLRSVVDALISAGIPILPASLSTAIQASSASHRISRLSVENTAEAIIGCVMQIDASLWRSDQLRVNTLSPNDEWMRSLVTKETMQHLDLRGRQPLSMAAEMGLFNVCAELISNGADVDHVDLDGWTPLMWAAVRPKWTKIYVDHCEVRDRAAVLLGIAVELKGHFSENEVYEDFNLSRMIENKIRIVCLLYDHGADMLRREPFLSYTAYDLASRDGLTTIADLLSSLNETMPEGLLEDTFSHRRDQVRTDTTTVYAEQSKLLTEAESEQDRQSWRLGLNWISCGTSTCRDDTVFICGGDSGPLEAMDRADVHQGEMEVQGTHIYLPNGVLQAIYSSIQLHVGNLDLSDEANVLYGRAVRQVEDFATDRASSFLRLRPQAETQSARDDYNRGVRSLFRQFEERKRRRDY